jgi:hypothetical protein
MIQPAPLQHGSGGLDRALEAVKALSHGGFHEGDAARAGHVCATLYRWSTCSAGPGVPGAGCPQGIYFHISIFPNFHHFFDR